MGLATPTAVMVGTGRAAEAGILVRNAEALERAGHIDTVVFDKTGTLTRGKPAVERVLVAPGFHERQVIDLAASAERGSAHPIGLSIVARANTDELGFGKPDAFQEYAGHGIAATVAGREVLVGTQRFLEDRGVALADLRAADTGVATDAPDRTLVHVAIDGAHAGTFVITDPVRLQSAEAVRDLRRAGIDVWLVSGDVPGTVAAVAAKVGIQADRAVGGTLPAGKAELVARLQAEGRRVAMVGDGINDAPALAQADLGVSIASGTDVAVESSDVMLIGGDPRSVLATFVLSRRTTSVIRQNLFWAFAYNVLLIPIAMGVLFPFFGILLSPALAAGAMALSSVTVVTNSLRLRNVDVRSGSAGATELSPTRPPPPARARLPRCGRARRSGCRRRGLRRPAPGRAGRPASRPQRTRAGVLGARDRCHQRPAGGPALHQRRRGLPRLDGRRARQRGCRRASRPNPADPVLCAGARPLHLSMHG